MTSIAAVLSDHQKEAMGMSSGSPDTCKCKAKVYPVEGDTDITLRRDTAFATHQMLALASSGLVDTEFLGTAFNGYPKVTRLELISNSQREVVEYGVSNVWTSLQDEGRTLKIFKEVEDGS